MTNRITLFCLVDGEATSHAFPVKVCPDDTVGDLKELIKIKQAPAFDDITANNLTLWKNRYKELRLESIDNMLGLLMYQRCMFGNHDLVLKEVNPELVEHAFGRIKIIKGHAVTVMDEPFVSLAVQNYFAAIDPYFAREVRK
ncbi:hypothetical protein BGZ67_000422, partial [Mortierella alpina]